MVPNKLTSKQRAIIWALLVAATILNCVYDIYFDIANTTIENRMQILSMVFDVILTILIPIALCFLAGLLVYQLGFRRYVRCISRSDFIHFVLMFTAAVRFVLGLISVFAILEPKIAYFTEDGAVSHLLLTGAMLLMFFVIASRYNFNPVEKANAFSMWATLYMVVLGVTVLSEGLVLFLATDPANVTPEMAEIFASYGIEITQIDNVMIAAMITDIVVYAAYLVAVIVLGVKFRKDALSFRDPETRGDYYDRQRQSASRNGVEQSFPDLFGEKNGDGKSDDKDDNIFDEFDL